MPCFIRLARRLRIAIPENVSLFDPEDRERIEMKLKARLRADTHKELEENLTAMKKEEQEEILKTVLNELSRQKALETKLKQAQRETYPDRFKDLRRRWREIWAAPAAQ